MNVSFFRRISFCFLLAGVALQTFGQEMKAVVSQEQIPVLVNKGYNPVLTVCCQTPTSNRVTELVFRFEGTTVLADLQKIYITVASGAAAGKTTLLAEAEVHGPVLRVPVDLVVSDSLCFGVSCDVSPTSRLSHFVDIQCTQIQTDRGKVIPFDTGQMAQRLGVAVQDAGWEHVNTYRIPGLACTNSGTLLAIYDARYDNSRDLQGHIDIGVSRSCDGGQTWEPMRIALDRGEWGGLPQKYNGVSDAGILVDKNSGDVFVAGLWMHGLLDREGKWMEGLTAQSQDWRHQWVGTASQPGFGVKETCQFLITRSRDDGKTWEQPQNITMAKDSAWWLFAPAPGCGIVMENGTLVFPTQGRDEKGLPFSNITFSQDGGQTWETSGPAYTNTTECAVVELTDGSLMLNMRNNRNGQEKGERNGRAIFTTSDMGKHWTRHTTSEHVLIEPVCMGALYKHEYGHGKSVLLFTNPDSKYHRNHLTLKASFDDGRTWTKGILLDAGDSFGYSCITSVDESTVGILYEGSRAQMVFQTVNLKEILK